MSEDRRQLIKSLGFLSGLGISMVASCLIGMGMGYYLDKWLGEHGYNTSPWLTLVFLGFGIAAGFRNVYLLTEKELRRQQRENGKDPDQKSE